MTREISLAGNPIEVEVAQNDAHRYKGLSDRDELGKDEGMMFVWPMEKEHGLVMRDMNFGVDMVFADGDGKVTKVHSADPDGEGTTAFSKYAVELPQGYCEVAGVEKSDQLELNVDGLGKISRDTMSKSDLFKDLEGVSFYSEINDTEVKIVDVEGDKVRVTDEENEWWERMEDVRDKITDGAWEEKEDPCWEGYEQVGMKEGENGEKVPDCVPKDSEKAKVLKAIDEVLEDFRNSPTDKVGQTEKAWIPYQGPQGGEGWQNGANPNDVRYVPDAPGQVDPEYEEIAEDWGSDEEEDGRSGDSPDVPESGTDQREEGYFVSAQPNPEEDVKRFQEDEGVSESIQATNEEPMEGFTVQRNLDSYDVWSDDVWMVGVDSVEFDTDRGISKDDVTEFYEEQLPALEASPALRVGGYHFDDGSKISIDLSVALTDQEEAEELGEQLKQESIFNPKKAMDTDFEEGSVMTYEGDDVGHSPVESPEEIKEILTNLQSLAKALVTAALRAALAKQMEEQNMSEEPRDMDARFENEAGEIVSRAQIFRRGWKESADVESTEEGYIVDGELFRTVE